MLDGALAEDYEGSTRLSSTGAREPLTHLKILSDEPLSSGPPPTITASAAKRVLLINPPRFHELIGKNPAIVEKHRGFNPPLGVLSIAAYVEAKSQHAVEVLDCQPTGMTFDDLRAELERRRFDVVGITAMTFTLIDVILTCQVLRTVNPKAVIVLGGPHVHLFPNETIRRPEVDFLIQGEGEIAFLDLLDKLDRPELLETVPGVVFQKADGTIVNAGVAPSTSNLDSLGIPARHKVDVTRYTSLLGRSDIITTMFTSRGCPFRCTFCDRPYSPVISGFRARSATHVVDEMEQCIALGIREAYIYDDTFTVREDRVFELCDEIKRRKIQFSWDVRAHVNTVTSPLLRAMREAGCTRIHFGVECGSDRMLRVVRKQTTVARVRAAFAAAKEAGLETLAYFIIGQQTETREDVEDTIKLAKQLDPAYVHFTVFCPYPGTEVYKQGLDRGIIKRDVWRAFAENPVPGYELPVWEENFTRMELRELLVHCYQSFYLRPGYLMRRVAGLRSPGEIRRKFAAGLSVLTMKPNDKVYDDDFSARVRRVVPRSPIEVHY